MRTITLTLLGIGLAVVGAARLTHAQVSPVWTSCTPVESMTYPSRVHVRCASAVGGIVYFALGAQDAAAAARALSVINTAVVAGRELVLLFDPSDTSGTAIGCAASDCRLFKAIGLKQ